MILGTGMQKIIGAIAALALGAPITSGFAADLRMPVKAPPPVAAVVPYNWTGFYIGANAGYSWGRDPIDVNGSLRLREIRGFGTPGAVTRLDTGVVQFPLAAGTANVNGPLAGGQVGYNWQTGSFVWGFETDLQWTGQKGGLTFCFPLACGAGAFQGTIDHKIDWFGTFRARAGALIDPRVLIYATGGLAYGQVTTTATGGVVGQPFAALSSKATRAGWTIGGGVEGALSNNWTVKAEYLYMDLGNAPGISAASQTILPNTPETAITTVIDATVATGGRVRDHIFRVGLNYRFGPEPIVARY
jgi:outer membrane immunogenic protein